MKKILIGFAAVAFGLVANAGLGFAAEEAAGHNAAEPTHFPIHKPRAQEWSFAGPVSYTHLTLPTKRIV